MYSVSFDANTDISVGLLPGGLAIVSLRATWLSDSFLYNSSNTCFLVPIYLVASLGLGLMKASGDLLNVAS